MLESVRQSISVVQFREVFCTSLQHPYRYNSEKRCEWTQHMFFPAWFVSFMSIVEQLWWGGLLVGRE